MKDSQLVALRDCPLFESLDSMQIAMAIEGARSRHVAAGETLFREGDLTRSAFLVLRGEIGARTEVLGEDGSALPFRPVLVKFGPGEVFGEYALLDEAPRSAEGFATADTALLELDPEWLDGLARREPQLACTVLRNLAVTVVRRGRVTTQQLRGALEWGWKARGLNAPE